MFAGQAEKCKSLVLHDKCNIEIFLCPEGDNGKSSKISNSFIILFLTSILAFRSLIHIIIVSITNIQGLDQTAPESARFLQFF